MGNGAKAAEARARKKDTKKGSTSQLKTNAAAKTIKCKICFQDFQGTSSKPTLTTHAENRHSKKYEDCFNE